MPGPIIQITPTAAITTPTKTTDHTYQISLEVGFLHSAGEQHGLEWPSVRVLKIQQQQGFPHGPHTLDVAELCEWKGGGGGNNISSLCLKYMESVNRPRVSQKFPELCCAGDP